ncbi:uncharacterized protein JCM6883_000913 [Sporobolomyces salmoneus]|uniref:uncharacterized protein n=1 Tax=Sporobolomyces salmoneus TaxID=183962 RepID=UPI00317608AE
MRSSHFLAVFAVLSLPSGFAAPISRRNILSASTSIDDVNLQLVQSNLADSAKDTWTAGTYGQALLELSYPNLSVFSPNFATASSSNPSDVVTLVKSWEAKRPSWTKELAFVENGAAGDPPALGVPWIVAATSEGGEDKAKLWEQAREQLEYLLQGVPRTSDGAISHRPPTEKVQLWADFMYMVPPFLAYYGVMSHNSSLVEEAFTQLKLYRNYLSTPDSKALRHVVLGDWQDNGLWATGNGWAAAGMTRVAATMQHSEFAGQFADEIGELKQWTKELLEGSFAYLRQDGLLPNYFDIDSSFSDASGSALLAATAYRLATLDSASSTNYTDILQSASKIRTAVNSQVQASGWLAQVVDPLSFAQQSQTSPEGQAFVLLLHAAWSDYTASQN